MTKYSDTVGNGYNETYSTQHRKYTINIPNNLFKLAEAKSKEAGYAELAPYIRHVISREVKEGTLSIQDILGQKETKKQEYLRIPTIEQRREMPKYSFVRLKVTNFIDKVLHRQLYFNWK